MSHFLLPRKFSDIEVPLWEGKKLNKTLNGLEYRYYVNWLADHLYKKTKKKYHPYPVIIAERINDSTLFGFRAWDHYLYCYKPFEEYIRKGERYEVVFAQMSQQFELIYQNVNNQVIIDQLDDWINENVWENAIREFDEIKSVEARHPDIGYRHQITELLDDIVLHNDRYAILDVFFQSYVLESTK